MYELSGVSSTYMDRRNAYKFSVRKPEVKPLGKSGRRWENDIKMDLKEVLYKEGKLIFFFRIG